MTTKLFVGSLSFNITEDELRAEFEPFGNIVSLSMIQDRETGRPKGFAFVEMSSDEEAQAAITALNGKEVAGRAMIVNVARPKEDRPRPSFGGGGHGGGGGGGGRRY